MVQPVAGDAPALFRRGISPAAKSLFGALLAIALMVADSRQHWASNLREVVETALEPLQVSVTLPGDMARQSWQFMTLQGELLNRIAALEAENDRLHASQRELSGLQRENETLRQILELPTEHFVVRRPVELLQRGGDAASQRFLVSAGLRDGIRTGFALIAPDGVVGQVVSAGERRSVVAMVTDKDQATPVQIVRTGQRAVLFGEGVPGRLSLRFLANNADIQPGDALVTSGLDGIYPTGMPVANVVSVKRDSASEFALVRCKPAANLESRRHFLVVTPAERVAPGAAP